jgi:hypothetical protein
MKLSQLTKLTITKLTVAQSIIAGKLPPRK